MKQQTDKDLILEVNNRFYEALARRDVRLMGSVFVTDERAGCVHPGWMMLRGWEAIRQSWENVFDPADRLHIRLHNVTVDIFGGAACVTCIQELTYVRRDSVMMNVSVSTNIFEKTESGWLMVIHHATPVPFVGEDRETKEKKIQ